MELAVVLHLIQNCDHSVCVLDELTYVGNLDNVNSAALNARFGFAQVDIGDIPAIRALIASFQPTRGCIFSAEGHVDRSIDGPAAWQRIGSGIYRGERLGRAA